MAEGSPQKGGQTKKGPTPKRRAQEAANFRPLVPEDRKEAKRQMQSQMRQRQQEQREGMARGDDRFLRESDRGPQKRFLRDVIDARFSLGEFLLPLMFIVIFVTFIPNQQAGVIAMTFIWAYLAVAIVEGLVVANLIKRRLTKAVGVGNVDRGIILGTLTRILQLRMLRMPKARVKRGEKVEYTGK